MPREMIRNVVIADVFMVSRMKVRYRIRVLNHEGERRVSFHTSDGSHSKAENPSSACTIHSLQRRPARYLASTMFAFIDTRALLILVILALIIAVGLYVLYATKDHR